MPKPNDAFIGTEEECDWCGEKFVLAKRNQLCTFDGNWVLTRCDICTAKHNKEES